MTLFYSPAQQAIFQHDADGFLVADLTQSAFMDNRDVDNLGRLFVAADTMLSALEDIVGIKPDDHGDRTLSPETMKAIWFAIDATRA